MLPVFANDRVCEAVTVPTGVVGKLKAAGLKFTTGPIALPLKLILWGEPAASSAMTMVPLRDPAALGVNVMERVQLPPADKPGSQLSVSEKSPVVVIDAIESGALPMFRTTTVWGWLLVPII
jgi:hypothetical protein